MLFCPGSLHICVQSRPESDTRRHKPNNAHKGDSSLPGLKHVVAINGAPT